MCDEQFTQHIQNVPGVEPAFDTNGETLSCILIDHAQHTEHLAIMRTVLDEVIRPDVAFVHRP